jgi:hypothetical protein
MSWWRVRWIFKAFKFLENIWIKIRRATSLMKEKLGKILYPIICVAALIGIIGLISSYFLETDDIGSAASTTTEPSATKEDETNSNRYVKVKTTITSETLEDGLRDMGVLITQEYYFTQVENYEKTKTIMKFFTSSSNFIYSYDGVVSAGVDFNNISVEKDDTGKVITITVPQSEIQYVDIDYDSFKIYSEKDGLWNPTSIEDYNDSLVDLKKSAKDKAIEKGVLDKADENAKAIIQNFVTGMVDDSDYTIKWK